MNEAFEALDAAGVSVTWVAVGAVVLAVLSAVVGGWLMRGIIRAQIDAVVAPIAAKIDAMQTTFLDALRRSEDHRDVKIAEVHSRIDKLGDKLNDHVVETAEKFMPRKEIADVLQRIEQSVLRVERRQAGRD